MYIYIYTLQSSGSGDPFIFREGRIRVFFLHIDVDQDPGQLHPDHSPCLDLSDFIEEKMKVNLIGQI